MTRILRGWQRDDYGFFGGRSPYRRHLRNNRAEERQWSVADVVRETDIASLREKEGPTLERVITEQFLTLQELSTVMKTRNRKRPRGKKIEYYAFLNDLRDQDCIPAMQEVFDGRCATVRRALLDRLTAEGILLEG